jgi:hypothetical protein
MADSPEKWSDWWEKLPQAHWSEHGLGPGTVVRFTYVHPKDAVDDNTGDRFKEILVLHPHWMGKVHGIDLKRLTDAEREVLFAIFSPQVNQQVKEGKPHRLPLVNDVIKRMQHDVLTESMSPLPFYNKFVKVFLRGKDAYRTYLPSRMRGKYVIKASEISGHMTNVKPLFHKVESKNIERAGGKPALKKPVNPLFKKP